MSPRTGRPKVDNPKAVSICIRLDSETEAKLQAYCLRNNISKGEAIRRGVHLLLASEKQEI
nr:MAG TPA: Alginate and motility regulator [Caudoviricetes sp.]